MLKSLGLSLSSICGADCIFCPSNRGQMIKKKIMPFEYVEEIINEIASKEFKKYHDIISISVGENGDAFLNKDFIKILRFIKLKVPQSKIVLFTNFQNFTEDKTKIILEEKLIDSFHCNIDGSNEKNYFNIKKLNLKNTTNNLMNFLEIRKRTNCNVPLIINVLTLNNYIKTINYNFKFYPIKLKDFNLIKTPDDYLIIRKQFEKILDFKKDKIHRLRACGWAEREQIDISNINYKKYSCPELNKMKSQILIAPNGTWYACCADFNNELVFGNVIKQSINEIFFGRKRQRLMKLLKNKQFSEIGGPCKTVNCCESLNKNKLEQVKFEIRVCAPKIKSKLETYLPEKVFSVLFKVYKKLMIKFILK